LVCGRVVFAVRVGMVGGVCACVVVSVRGGGGYEALYSTHTHTIFI